MVQGMGKIGAAASAAFEGTQAINTPVNTGGAGAGGGLLSSEKDAKEAATSTKFGDVYKQIQAKYGEKPEKPREIKKTLGKDDFLRIMVTQMKNQDPTSPFKAEQMATEIAQFTSVEQLQNVNQNLNKMASQNRPLEQMAMTNLIGKVVTIDRERFPHLEGQNDELAFNLPKSAASVHVVVISEAGEQVFEKNLGDQKSGSVSFSWDGIKSNTLPAKAGNYFFRVDAKDGNGKPIEINPQLQSRVIGVSFENSEPVFLVGDAHHQDKVTMKNIIRIESDLMPEAKPPGIPVARPVGRPVGRPVERNEEKSDSKTDISAGNLINFQKGVGSSTVSAAEVPGVGYMQQRADEKGFPNGLKEGGENK